MVGGGGAFSDTMNQPTRTLMLQLLKYHVFSKFVSMWNPLHFSSNPAAPASADDACRSL